MVSWENLGGGFNSGPGVSSWGPGRLDVFGQGLDGACWHQAWENGWSGWESLGGGFTSEIDAVSWDSGRIDVFGRGTDNACWHQAWDNNAWSGWESLGGGLNSGASACSWAPGRLDVFAQGLDGACWHKWWENGWSEWENLGGVFTSGIASVSWDHGRIDLFGKGGDNACWHKWYDGAWSEWENLGGAFTSGFGVSSWGPGRLDVFGRGTDNACWHKWWENGWSEWESLGGGFTSGPAAVSWDLGRIDVFGRGTDDACWHSWFEGSWAGSAAPAAAVPQAAGATLTLPVFDVIRLNAIQLPVFDVAASDQLKAAPTTGVASLDGAQWRTFTGWVEPPADGAKATVLCRKTGLSIRIEANGAAAAKLLPFAPGSPSATLSYVTAPGQPPTTVPMEAAVDIDGASVMLLLPFATPAAYGSMVKVLSDSASGIKVMLDFAHRFLTQQPAAPVPDSPPPHQSPPFNPRPGLEERLVGRKARDLRELRDLRDVRVQAVRPQLFTAVARADLADGARANLQLAAGPQLRASAAVRNPALLQKLRFASRDWSRVVVEPPQQVAGQPALTEAVVASRFELGVFRPVTDLAVYPDQPRVAQQGWGQVPGRPADKPVLHFKDSPRADVFFILPTRFKLGFFRGADPEGAEDLPPIHVTQYLDVAKRYRVAVSLVAIPYIADGDRDALTAHIREVMLQNMLPFVSLEPRAGLKASFVSGFNAGAGDDQQVLPETITFTAEEVLPDRRLSLRFDMDAMDYGIFCELLRKGIHGRVKLSEDTFQESLDVQLRLDDLVTNALQVDSEGFGAPDPSAAPAMTEEPSKRSVRLSNKLKYPARVSALRVVCVDRGAVPGMVLDAEVLNLLPAEQVLAPKGQADTFSYDVLPQRLAVWNDTVVSMGTIKVDGGTPQEWLDRVTRDPSLQPQRHVVKVTPVVPTGGGVKLVRLKLFLDGEPAVRQQLDILPTGSSELTIDLRLADLAAAGGKPPAFVLEYDCEYADGSLSLPQRLGVRPTVQELPISVLMERPTSVYKVEHGPADGELTVKDQLDRSAAADVIGQARTRGERWRVFARTPA